MTGLVRSEDRIERCIGKRANTAAVLRAITARLTGLELRRDRVTVRVKYGRKRLCPAAILKLNPAANG